MATSTTKTNKPIIPRGQDASPLKYNRAALYSGKALDFDGVNDEITPSGSYFVNPQSGTWTFCAYIYAENSGVVFSRDNQYLELRLNAGKLVARVYAGGWQILTLSNVDLLNEWNFVCWKYDVDNSTFTGYVNGVEQLTETLAPDSVLNFDRIASTGGSNFFDGKIGGVKIYDVGLTAAQVSDLYNNPEKIVPTGVEDTALKLWLPMMEGAGTTAYDGSGNGNHGTISGATYVNGVGAPVAQSAVIDWNKGTNLLPYSERFGQWTKNDSSVSDNVSSAPNGTTTADKWVINNGIITSDIRQTITSSVGQNYLLFVFAKAGEFSKFQLDTSNSQFSDVNVDFDLSTGSIVSSGGDNITEGIIDKGNGWYLCYMVGTAISTSGSFIIRNDATQTGDGSKGMYLWGGGYVQASDITPYIPTIGNNPQTSPVLLPQGLTTGRDITGVNLFENVRKQGALNLDGNSWAEVHDNASIDLSDANASFEAWVYHIDTGAVSQYIMNKFDGTTGIRFRTEASNNFGFYASDGTNNIADSGSFPLVANSWNHIVLTTDGTNFKRYINGALVDTDVAVTPLTTFANADSLYIGSEQTNASLAQSRIAQPRIYNRALTAEEVLRNFNASKGIYQ